MTYIAPHFNAYEQSYARSVREGGTPAEAAIVVAEAYLDGKPRLTGKHKTTATERDASFWSSEFLVGLTADAWQMEPLVLALARYMGQQRVSRADLIAHAANLAPEAIRRAIRYSGLVLQAQSPRRAEVERLAAVAPDEFAEIARILRAFDQAHSERVAMLDVLRQPLAALTPMELLVYASLYAFEHLVPRHLLAKQPPIDPDDRTEVVWDAINDLLIWKLSTASDIELRPVDGDIAKSLASHLSPFIFPSRGGPPAREDLYVAFARALAAQVEINSFTSRSADAFSYDDNIRFVLRDGRLDIVKVGTVDGDAWVRNGEKLDRLHNYWLYRALYEFGASGMAMVTIGHTENHEWNRFAYIKALRTHLQLTEVYGLEASVTTETGLRADLFQTLLSLELMTAFFKKDFMQPYLLYLREMGNSRMALGRLAFDGLVQPDSQNRFPLTWSDREAKISKITGWTVSKDHPHGSARAAEAILDFWTSDWVVLASRLREGRARVPPELLERPILKMGRQLVQLPWVVAIQNNATAAINNLRRIGARRQEAGEEARRVEGRLAKQFEERSFRTCLSYQPERTIHDDPGEVDLICARDGQVLVFEIKSTFMRRSTKDAWLHGATALRKAGVQLRRKVRAIETALKSDLPLAAMLGLEVGGMPPPIRAWIVDTSIEHDHQRFSGFLKVSVEEVVIALRDDRHLLNDPAGLLSGAWMNNESEDLHTADSASTLYPNGFSAGRFVDVIENGAVWDWPGQH